MQVSAVLFYITKLLPNNFQKMVIYSLYVPGIYFINMLLVLVLY